MTAPDPYLDGHGDTRYRVSHYDLDLRYKVSTNRLDETARLEIEIAEPTARLDVDLRGLHVDKVRLDGTHVKHRHRAGKVRIEIGDRIPGDRLTLELWVSGKPRPVRGVHGAAGWEELTDGVMVGSQPQGAPGWFPCNNDAADKATYRIRISTETGYHVVANGSLTQVERRGSTTRWTYEMNYPMAPYLASVQIGSYTADACASRVPVEIIRPRGRAVGAGTAFEHQGQMVDLFSDLFGPYPFDEYRAVIVDDPLEIPLEAQGLSTFGRNFLAPGWEHERLVAHELAHQWFGNAVTGQHLRDIWLHEGFACYAEWLWADHRQSRSGGPSVQDLARTHYAELPRVIPRGTLADPGMRAMFDDWVYKRGALTLHALRSLFGDTVFFELLHSWTAAHAGGTVTTADFAAHCRARAGSQADRLDALLQAWLHEPELPALPIIR